MRSKSFVVLFVVMTLVAACVAVSRPPRAAAHGCACCPGTADHGAEPTKVPEPTKAPEPTTAPEPTKATEPTKAPEPTVAPTAAPAAAGVMLPEVNPLEVKGDIVTAGSSTVFPLAEAMAERFKDEGYAGNITIDSIGSGGGFERFCVTGETDIANASRAIKDSEVESCPAIGRDADRVPGGHGCDGGGGEQGERLPDGRDPGRAGDDLFSDDANVVGCEPGVAE